MTRLFRRSFLLNLREEADDLAFVGPQRHVQLFWPTVFTLTLAFALLAAWLFSAQLAVTVEARGIVMPLGGVREIAALGRGVVIATPTKGQGPILAGDILAQLSDPAADAEYSSQRRSYQLEAALLETQRDAAERLYRNKAEELQIRLDGARANLTRLRSISSAFDNAVKERSATEIAMLQAQQTSTTEVKKLFDGMQQGADQLLEKGFASKRDYIQFRQGQASLLQTLSQLSIEKARLTVEGQQLKREISDIVGEITTQTAEEKATLGAMQEALSKRDTDIETLRLKASNSRNQLLDAERKLWMSSNVVVPYDGELLAIKKGLGQPVSQGESIALVSMAPQDPKSLLIFSPRAERGHFTLAYKDQRKAIHFLRGDVGFAASVRAALQELVPNVTFNTSFTSERLVIKASPGKSKVLEQIKLVETELFDDEDVPVFAMLFPIGDDWLVRELTMVVLLRPEDAKRVNVGDKVLVKPDFEKSLIGAQIEARVSQVSSYVTTSIESQSLVGSAEVARSLTPNQQSLQQAVAAVLRFDRDASGKLLIRGDSLARPLTAGSTATAHIQVDKASPIAVLLPFYINAFH